MTNKAPQCTSNTVITDNVFEINIHEYIIILNTRTICKDCLWTLSIELPYQRSHNSKTSSHTLRKEKASHQHNKDNLVMKYVLVRSRLPSSRPPKRLLRHTRKKELGIGLFFVVVVGLVCHNKQTTCDVKYKLTYKGKINLSLKNMIAK